MNLKKTFYKHVSNGLLLMSAVILNYSSRWFWGECTPPKDVLENNLND